jgi:hypothetical protein
MVHRTPAAADGPLLPPVGTWPSMAPMSVLWSERLLCAPHDGGPCESCLGPRAGQGLLSVQGLSSSPQELVLNPRDSFGNPQKALIEYLPPSVTPPWRPAS